MENDEVKKTLEEKIIELEKKDLDTRDKMI